jgi:hypothetical protein
MLVVVLAHTPCNPPGDDWKQPLDSRTAHRQAM